MCQELLRDISGGAAGQTGSHTEPEHLQQMQRHDVTLRCTETAHDCRAIEMACGIAPGRGRYGDPGQQYARQRGQSEEFLRPVQNFLQLRACSAHAFDPLSRRKPRLRPPPESRQRRRRARNQQAVRDTTARADQAGGRNVAQIHEQPWREAERICATVRFVAQYVRHRQRRGPEMQPGPGLQSEPRDRTGIEPYCTRHRDGADRPLRPVGHRRHAQRATQRIAAADRLDFEQFGPAGSQHHARKTDRLGSRQAQTACAADKPRIPGTGRINHEIGTEQCRCLTLHERVHAVGEKSHGRGAGNGNGDRRHQYPQFSGTPVARQPAQRKPQHAHGLPLPSRFIRPPRSRQPLPAGPLPASASGHSMQPRSVRA